MRDEFTGMLPGAVAKFEELFDKLAGLNPRVTAGYSSHGGDDDLRTWGVVVSMSCDNNELLDSEAEALGIAVQEDGSLAYTNGLTLADFQTGRVGGDLTINEMEVL